MGETTFGKGLVQTIMPLRNVRGYALALTTARYYTPSGRSIQRDYGSTALEDYVAPRDRKALRRGRSGDAKLTDAGRKVFGGDGITPDYCVRAGDADQVRGLPDRRGRPSCGFARNYAAAEDDGPRRQIAGAGSRSERDLGQGQDDRPRLPGRRRRCWRTSRPTCDGAQAASSPTRTSSREPRGHRARRSTEEVLRQVFGEGEARRRSMAWDPQIQKALELVPRAELLLKDPQKFVAEKMAEGRMSDTAHAGQKTQQQPQQR